MEVKLPTESESWHKIRMLQKHNINRESMSYSPSTINHVVIVLIFYFYFARDVVIVLRSKECQNSHFT